MFSKYKKISDEELESLREISRLVMYEQMKASYFEKNTALLNVQGNSGKTVAEQQKRCADVMAAVRDEHFNTILGSLGYPEGTKATINLKNGKVTLQK